FLRREGIRFIEQAAGRTWTDFNAHDPGITILEQLCYAITDLGYRMAYDLPDLLAEGEKEPSQSLYTPAQILSSEPVTLTDMRKLLLDVEGVKNAWIEPLQDPAPLYYHEGKKVLSLETEDPVDTPQTTEPVFLKGLYRVLLEPSALVDREGSQVAREAAKRLNAHRNLCEDFDEITVLDHQDVSVLARIEIGPVEDAGELLANIYDRIAHYFSPSLPFKTLNEMLASGVPVDEIFEGPLLKHGFLDAKALQNLKRKTTLYISDLIREIMAVDGVRAVRHIRLKSGETTEAWSLQLGERQVPKLVLSSDTIVLEKEGVIAGIDHDRVKALYHERLKRAETFAELPLKARDIAPPQGKNRKIKHYHAVQQQFPALYGIGEIGLPASATPERKAQARQLTAYLLFFDQLLANYFAQLSHASSLFSFYGRSNTTYFSQMISDPGLRLDGILRRSPEEHRARLEKITEETAGDGVSIERKNLFLNHLMARFSEQFTDYALVLFGLMEDGRQASLEKLIQDKQVFLQKYPEISRARGGAFDALRPWGGVNISGLEERIRLKLGVTAQDGEDFLLIEHILLRPMSGDQQQGVPILAAVQSKDPYSLQLSFVFPNWPVRFARPVFQQFIAQTIREETPAHLIPHVHWLDQPAWRAISSTYKDWLEKRRRFLAAKYELS
ncbi:MAG: hypothetical protein ACE5F7_07080, partial [Nitrospiria bacterium]